MCGMKRWLPALMFMIFIGWIIVDADLGGANPFIQFANHIPYGDKIGHACIYAVMAILVTIATQFKRWQLAGTSIFYGTSAVLLFALVEEGTQFFLKTRNFDLWDALADVVGVCVATLLLNWWQQQQKPSPN